MAGGYYREREFALCVSCILFGKEFFFDKKLWFRTSGEAKSGCPKMEEPQKHVCGWR